MGDVVLRSSAPRSRDALAKCGVTMLRSAAADERGQGRAEYGLILGLSRSCASSRSFSSAITFRGSSAMSATASKRPRPALVDDDAGIGSAQFSLVLGTFAVQCICGAIALNHHIDGVIRAIQGMFA